MRAAARQADVEVSGGTAPRWHPYLLETQYEFLRLLRARTFSLATIGFPVMFYLLFGVIVGNTSAEATWRPRYLLATYSIFGLAGVCLFGISVTMANERALGWLEVKLASPMPAPAYLLSKLLTAAAFAMLIFGVLVTLGTAFGHVRLAEASWIRLTLTVLGGVLPFASMGMLLAMLVPPNAATGVVNLIYLPMSFLSGLWIPLEGLPTWLSKTAFLWPTWHMGQLALWSIGYPLTWKPWQHIIWLAMFTVAASLVAALLFRRNAAKSA